MIRIPSSGSPVMIGKGMSWPDRRRDPLVAIPWALRVQINDGRNLAKRTYSDTSGAALATAEGASIAAVASYDGTLLSQTTAGNRPILRRTYDAPRLLFDGVNDCLVNAAAAGLQGAGWFFVPLLLTWDTNAVLLKSGRWFLTLRTGNKIALTTASAVLCEYDATAFLGQHIVVSGRFDYANGAVDNASATGTLFINGTQVATGTSSSVPAQSGIGWGANTNASSPYIGEMAGALIKSGSLTAGELTAIHSYLPTLNYDSRAFNPASIANLKFSLRRGVDVWDATTAGGLPADLASLKRWGGLIQSSAPFPWYQASTGRLTYSGWQADSAGALVIPASSGGSDNFTFSAVLKVAHLGKPGAGGATTSPASLRNRRTIISNSDGTFRVFIARGGEVKVELNGAVESTGLYMPTSRAWFAVRTGASPRVWINNETAALAGSYTTSKSLAGGYLFAVPAVDGYHPLQAGISAAQLYTRALTDAEIYSLKAASLAFAPVLSVARNVVIVGTSLDSGYNASPLQGWHNRLSFALGTSVYNMAEPGIAFSTIQSEFATYALPRYRAGVPNLLILGGPRNDVGGSTAAQILARIAAVCAAGRAAGFSRILVSTITPYNADDAAAAIRIADYRTGLIAGLGTTIDADGIIDFTASATLSNAANFPDGLHWPDAGHADAAALYQAQLGPFAL